MVKLLINLFKLRIGVIMSITALVALVVTPGQPVQPWEALLLTIAVLLAASSAGAFNQYYER
ncbi:MAG: protoheme IX farnesyltransferase, partial [Gammaproteobacteria bacterium]|nr:protoheme IX farnesyltransferase [Gammaproteobacteria bacterium]